MRKNKKYERGFTFIEVMVVVVILATLAALVIPRLTGRVEEAKKTKVVLQMRSIMQALELYKLDNSMYPTTEQGLQALVDKPETEPIPSKWKRYMDKIPKDPWKRDYIYISPGTHTIGKTADKDSITGFDLMCLGPKGVEGGEENIVSWDLPEE